MFEKLGFGKKEEAHSREDYERASDEAYAADRAARFFEGGASLIGGETLRKEYILSKDEVDIAIEKLRKMFNKDRTEATALNEEYNTLLTNAMKAMQALKDFEKEKLGMHQEKE